MSKLEKGSAVDLGSGVCAVEDVCTLGELTVHPLAARPGDVPKVGVPNVAAGMGAQPC